MLIRLSKKASASYFLSNALQTFLGTIAGSAAVSASHAGITGTVLNNNTGTSTALTSWLNGSAHTPGSGSIPRAYINWIFLDEQFNTVTSGGLSGADPVNSASDALKNHYKTVSVTKNGYLYVYCSNESDIDVFFDNLQVIQTHGPLVSEDHYYPFGLTMAGISSQALNFGQPENNRLYNKGSELQHHEFSDGSGLELYATNFRSLDPQLGRWWQIDPKPDYAQSLYSAMNNNPISFNDPLGDTIRGYDKSSGEQLKATAQGSFSDKNTQSLFKLKKDGITFKHMGLKAFTKATKNLNSDQLKLASAYRTAINDNKVHTVEMVSQNSPLGKEVNSSSGGGVTFGGGGNSLSVIVTDASRKGEDYYDANTGQQVLRSPTAGELVAHEVLGHGTSDNSDFNANSMDALHMSNIYLSAQGSSLYRNGSYHDYEGSESINIEKSNAYDVPNVYVPGYLGAALLQPLAIMTNF